MQEGNRQELSSWDLSYAVDMAIACLISDSIVTYILSPFLPTSDALLGGMWATVATVFVFRETRADSLSAGISRLVATCVSICAVFGLPRDPPFSSCRTCRLGRDSYVIMLSLGRDDDVVTTGITATVVMVVAAIGPQKAWQQPLLRLVDTLVGIAVGVVCKWTASSLYYRRIGQPAG